MRKRILPYILAVLICLSAFLPHRADALTALDPQAPASLTLHYQKEETAFAGLSIGIYRVAQAFPDGTFGLIAPFASWPVYIHDITRQEQWHVAAQTLCSYIVSNQVAPDREETTDETGTVCFTGLQTGLYFVREVTAENANGTYVFNQFLVYVPTPESDGTFTYDVTAYPKCVEFVPKTHYTVTKLWQDTGHEDKRPASVTIDIYHDGILWDTQILSANNQWSYTWTLSGEEQGKWVVTERNVPEGYKVTVRQTGNVFTVINTGKTEPDIPQTGDTFSPMPWVLLMCLSGMGMVLLGIYDRRRR